MKHIIEISNGCVVVDWDDEEPDGGCLVGQNGLILDLVRLFPPEFRPDRPKPGRQAASGPRFKATITIDIRRVGRDRADQEKSG